MRFGLKHKMLELERDLGVNKFTNANKFIRG